MATQLSKAKVDHLALVFKNRDGREWSPRNGEAIVFGTKAGEVEADQQAIKAFGDRRLRAPLQRTIRALNSLAASASADTPEGQPPFLDPWPAIRKIQEQLGLPVTAQDSSDTPQPDESQTRPARRKKRAS